MRIGQPGEIKAQQVWEMKGCKLTKHAAVRALPLGFCFLLQTLESYYEEHGGIPLDQWLAWKATKTNPTSQGMHDSRHLWSCYTSTSKAFLMLGKDM